MPETAPAPPAEKPGQPAGVLVLASAEMWARFSFYGVLSLLALYLVEALRYSWS